MTTVDRATEAKLLRDWGSDAWDHMPEAWRQRGRRGHRPFSKHGDGSHDEADHGNWASGGAAVEPAEPPSEPRPDYYPWDDSKTEAENTAASQKRYAERAAWDMQMARAVALGSITADEAKEQGWSDPGVGTIENVQPLPAELYHATTALSQVMESGLKTRAELNDEAGLGGGTDNTISFTTDQALAERIAETLAEAGEVARGDITFDDLMARADEAGFGDRIREMPGFDKYVAHVKYSNAPGLWDAEGIAAKEGPGDWKPMEGSYSVTGNDGVTRYASWQRSETPEEATSARFEVYRKFLAFQEEAGGPADPMFWSPDFDALARIDPGNVGVVRAQPVPGAMGYPTSGMSEWRTWSGDAVKVEQLVRKMRAVAKHADHDQSSHGNWARGGSEAGSEIPGLSRIPAKLAAEHPWEAGAGNCYPAAATIMIDLGRQLEDPRVVHAEVTGRGPVAGIRFGHAWVEYGPGDNRMVLDLANGNDVIDIPAAVYRALGQADIIGEYDWEETLSLLVESGNYGPWE